jgi:hypothetical protein
MPIKVACKCGQQFAANDNLAGKRVKCPKCGQPLTIPAAGGQEAKGQSPKAPSPKTQPAKDTKAAPKASPGKTAASTGGAGGMSDLFDEAGISAPDTQTPRCPNCGTALSPYAVLCVQCGFNLQTGQRLASDVKHTAAVHSGEGHGAATAELMARAERTLKETPAEHAKADHGDSALSFLVAAGLLGFTLLAVVGAFYGFRWMDAALFPPLAEGEEAPEGRGLRLVFFMLNLFAGMAVFAAWAQVTVSAFQEDKPIHGVACLFCCSYAPIYAGIRWRLHSGIVVLFLVASVLQSLGAIVVTEGNAESVSGARITIMAILIAAGVIGTVAWCQIASHAFEKEESLLHVILCIVTAGLYAPIYGIMRWSALSGPTITYIAAMLTQIVTFITYVVLLATGVVSGH